MKRFCIILVVLLSTVLIVVSQDNTLVKCGDIIENEFTKDSQSHNYEIDLSAGTQIDLTGLALGDTLGFSVAAYAPNGSLIAVDTRGNFGYSFALSDPRATTGIVSANGTYTIIAYNGGINQLNGRLSSRGDGGVGVYTLSIECVLLDGTVIKAGDVSSTTTLVTPEFSGYGFPGLSSISFTGGIVLPLTVATPALAPIGGDLVALYTYDASAGSTATLSVSRASGNISIGVAVIHKATNQIIFMGGMPFSDKLSVELSFPLDGTYVIGLFQLVTTEASDTSGAVHVLIE